MKSCSGKKFLHEKLRHKKVVIVIFCVIFLREVNWSYAANNNKKNKKWNFLGQQDRRVAKIDDSWKFFHWNLLEISFSVDFFWRRQTPSASPPLVTVASLKLTFFMKFVQKLTFSKNDCFWMKRLFAKNFVHEKLRKKVVILIFFRTRKSF